MSPPMRLAVAAPISLLMWVWLGAWLSHFLVPDHWSQQWFAFPLVLTGVICFLVMIVVTAFGLAMASEKVF